jgi:hypothetical protein
MEVKTVRMKQQEIHHVLRDLPNTEQLLYVDL